MSDEKKPFHNPFGALQGLKESLPKGPGAPAPKPPKGPPPPAKAVVRLERSGRKGKEVTVVEQLGLSREQREAWLTALKSQLGCGGAVEEENLVLQGDQRERVKAVLEKKGVKKVVVGN